MNNEVIISIIISLLFIIFSLLNWVYYLYKKLKILETQINLMMIQCLQAEFNDNTHKSTMLNIITDEE